MDVELLRDAAFPLPGGEGCLVPAPVVKSWLHELVGERLPTPRGVALPAGDAGSRLAHAAWDGLAEPLRLKAFGPGLVGAVGGEPVPGALAQGLRADQVPAALARMGRSLGAGGRLRHGYLIEEQPPGDFSVGVGVTFSEDEGGMLSYTAGCLVEPQAYPLDRSAAEQLVGSVWEPETNSALVELLLAVAAPDGSVTSALGDLLVHFDCSVVLTPGGVCAVDTRLILAAR